MSKWRGITNEIENEQPSLRDLLRELDKEYELIQSGLLDNMRKELDKDIKRYCPDCGNVLEFEGGCVTCRSCGWSKCG